MTLQKSIFALLLATAVSLHAQTTYKHLHADYFDDISTRRINLGQTDEPHRAGRTGFCTTQMKLQLSYLVEVSPELSPGSGTSAGVTQTRTATGAVETWQATCAQQTARRFFFRINFQIP